MRRWTRSIAVFLAAGAIVSVLVAWACACLSPHESDQHFRMSAIQHEWTAPKPRWWPEWDASDPRRAFADDGFAEDRAYGFGIRCVDWIPPGPEPLDPEIYGTAIISMIDEATATETSAGWPLYCLRGQQLHAHVNPDPTVRGWWAKNGILLDRRARHRDANWGKIILPLEPIWTGLAVDAIVYGALLWLVTLGPRTMRRLVRRARGRCVRCGYRLTGLTADRCPECGGGSTP